MQTFFWYPSLCWEKENRVFFPRILFSYLFLACKFNFEPRKAVLVGNSWQGIDGTMILLLLQASKPFL